MRSLIDFRGEPWRRAAGLAAAAALLLMANTAGPAESTLTGRLLVAVPEMEDSNFARTIVYLVEHNRRGALGVVVNEPMGEVPLDLLLGERNAQDDDRPKPDKAGPRVLVHYGGPVERRAPFILHSTDVMPAGSVKVDKRVAFSRDHKLLRAVAGGMGPRHLVFALGYAGWAPGQLESEIKGGGWYVIDWDETLVFGTDHADKWQRAIALHAPEL
ncbi:MAG: YqgE/AlgH family protein [Rhodospirillales bacterium]|nr:YqgE/AlgH family protein [Rhodospirillales bacterium]MDH3913689.1 YqgE/AlgH family protein [Rhodospirillales bacterium]MDH3967894.1 YqgE/AlgH family protein [Rhodospirillales bacterium]